MFLLLVFRRYLETFYITEQCPRFQYRTITIEQYRTITIEVTALYCLSELCLKTIFDGKLEKENKKQSAKYISQKSFL